MRAATTWRAQAVASVAVPVAFAMSLGVELAWNHVLAIFLVAFAAGTIPNRALRDVTVGEVLSAVPFLNLGIWMAIHPVAGWIVLALTAIVYLINALCVRPAVQADAGRPS